MFNIFPVNDVLPHVPLFFSLPYFPSLIFSLYFFSLHFFLSLLLLFNHSITSSQQTLYLITASSYSLHFSSFFFFKYSPLIFPHQKSYMSSCSSYGSSSKPVIKCRCGIPVALKTSMTELNPGRRFLTCKFYNPETQMRGCNWFYWVDEDKNEMRLLKSQMAEQKHRLERLEEMASGCALEISHNNGVVLFRENEKRMNFFVKVLLMVVNNIFIPN